VLKENKKLVNYWSEKLGELELNAIEELVIFAWVFINSDGLS
jgi:hypothetical protein